MSEQSEGTRGMDSVARKGGLADLRSKPFALWVIAGTLVYSGLAVSVLVVELALDLGLLAAGGILLVISLFVALFFVAALFALKERRWAYVLTAAVSVAFLLLNSPYLVDSLSNPADSAFWLSISLLPALLLATGFSILSFRSAKTGLHQRHYLSTPHSTGGLLTLAVIGFVVGGLVVGAIGAGVINGLISAVNPDIEIVPGAPTAAVPYNPQTFRVAVGGTVTWQNKDSTTHTVTSNGTGQFDSGGLTVGATWSFTFNTAGTYYYHCTPHPNMWGVVIVGG